MGGSKSIKEKLMRSYLKPIMDIGGKNNSYINKMIEVLSDFAVKKGDYNIQYRFFEKTADQMQICDITKQVEGTDTAIVIQGGITDKKFVSDSVGIYKKLYPGANIILSTWVDTDRDFISHMESEGVHVVMSEYPEYPGEFHINYQYKSSKAGIEKALLDGNKYTVKIRSDARIQRKNLISYLISRLELFPVSQEKMKYALSRIVTLPGGRGSMFLPYNLNDFFYFGETGQLQKMFSKMDYKENSYDKTSYLSEEINWKYLWECSPLITFPRNYLYNIGAIEKDDDTVLTYWNMMKNFFCTVSFYDLLFYFPKYTHIKFNMNETDCMFNPDDSEDHRLTYNWSPQNWQLLYIGRLEYKEEFERIRYRSELM